MKKIKKLNIILPALLLAVVFLSLTIPSKVSMRMVLKTESQGKTKVSNAEVFFQLEQNRLITRNPAPQNFFLVTTGKGEAKIYFPASNEVVVKSAVEADLEKSLLYFFIAGKMNDLGMKDMGFTLTDTKFDQKSVITTWFPPSSLINSFSKIEMIHREFKPVSVALFDKTGQKVKKISYSEYTSFPQFSFPTQVVQSEYLHSGDSVVQTITYTDVKVDDKAVSSYFNFKIPLNATVKK